jgi:hypothetical protein
MAEPDSIDSFIQVMNKASESTRASIAQQLKDAGFYKGKVTGKFDQKLYSALVEFGVNLTNQRKFQAKFGQPTVSIQDYLLELASEGSGDGTGGGPTTTRQTYVTSPTQTAKLLDTVAQDLLGRNLTKAEKAKYTRLINAEQKRQPSVNVSGAGFSTTTGGVDEEQFVTEKLQATGEAKNYRATDAYTVMMQELGGLR